MHELKKTTWGEIVNAAAILGLLYIGETELDLNPLLKFIIQRKAPLEKKIEDIRYVEFRDYRVLQLHKIPIDFWKNVLNTLSKVVPKDDTLFQSLLYYAIGYDSALSLGEYVFTFCLSNKLFCPLTISWLLTLPSFPRQQRYQFLYDAAQDKDFTMKFPDFAQDVIEAVPKYSSHTLWKGTNNGNL